MANKPPLRTNIEGGANDEILTKGVDALNKKNIDELLDIVDEQIDGAGNELGLIKALDTLDEICRLADIADDTLKASAEEALERFKSTILPAAKIRRDKYRKVLYARKGRKYALRIAASVILSVGLIFAANSFTVTYAGFDFLKPIIKWTTGLFEKKYIQDNSQLSVISSSEVDSPGKRYASYDEVEEDYNITLLKPSYLPLGYSLSYVSAYEAVPAKKIVIVAVFDNLAGGSISIRMMCFLDISEKAGGESYETSVTDITTTEVNGKTYYIVLNEGVYVATLDDYSCNYTISCKDGLEELTKIIENFK